MIRRDRMSIPTPSVLAGARSIGGRETTELRKWVEAGCEGKRPAVRAYKDSTVVEALEQLFHKKCAYCESPYGPTQPIDVEHWRPKFEVVVDLPEGRKTRIGYVWLAASWSNLLPSCIDCNRPRTQHIAIKRNGSLAVERWVAGKGNLFPLKDELKRLRKPRDKLEQEAPLLVDPGSMECDPDDLFDYTANGVMIARANLDSDKYQRALESIRIYALNRTALVEQRRQLLSLLFVRFAKIRYLISCTIEWQKIREQRTHMVLPPEVASNLRPRLLKETTLALRMLARLLEQELDELRSLAKPDRPYSQLVKLYSVAFLKSLSCSTSSFTADVTSDVDIEGTAH